MQQVNDYATQQTIIYKLMQSSTGLQKEPLKDTKRANQQLQKTLYLNGLIEQVQSLQNFQKNCRKLQQLIGKVQSNYNQLQIRNSMKSKQCAQLLKTQSQTKKLQIQMKALSFQSSEKYDYKIRLKQTNESRRKQLELILIEEKRLKDQILARKQIKLESVNVLSQMKNEYKTLSNFNQELIIQQIKNQQQVNANVELLNSKMEQFNKMKKQKQNIQLILQAAKTDNKRLKSDIQTLKNVKGQKQNIINELSEVKSNFLNTKQIIQRQKSICQMNLRQMKLNFQTLKNTGQCLTSDYQILEKQIISSQAQRLQIQATKITIKNNISQQQETNLMRKQQLLDNFKYIQMYEELNHQLKIQSKVIIPSQTQQQLQKIYYQRAKHYWNELNQPSYFRYHNFEQRFALPY